MPFDFQQLNLCPNGVNRVAPREYDDITFSGATGVGKPSITVSPLCFDKAYLHTSVLFH